MPATVFDVGGGQQGDDSAAMGMAMAMGMAGTGAGLTATTSPCIMSGVRGCTMGYTLVTRIEGSEYRYTEWASSHRAAN